MQKTNNLQDLFLLRARKSHASLTVFLMAECHRVFDERFSDARHYHGV